MFTDANNSCLAGNQDLLSKIGELSKVPYESVGRIARDLVFWGAAACLSYHLSHPLATVVAVIFIGAVPMHDLMVHGHEGVHSLISRRRPVNEFFNWFVHMVVGLSGSAYRAFHLEHHKKAHSSQDPEVEALQFIHKDIPGWTYLFLPLSAFFAINTYPLRHPNTFANGWSVARDLLFAAMAHFAILFVIGMENYLTYVTLPIVTSLALTNALRTICEHHNAVAGDRWLDTRTMKTSSLLEWLWSNVNYHLEHHLFSTVPYHKLPELHKLLAAEYTQRGAIIDEGYFSTSARLLAEPDHYRGQSLKDKHTGDEYMVNTTSLAFKMKVLWFKDILVCRPARQYLWNLYYAGEAYVELHPDGVFIPLLKEPLSRLLHRHLSDETRHATIFRALLAQDQLAPTVLKQEEDLGWYLLNHLVPDIVQKARNSTTMFSDEDTMRYMAFLHTLELRSVSDLYALLTAARQLHEVELVNGLETILPDELFHAAYTHKAVLDLAPSAEQARKLLNEMRNNELVHYTVVIKGMLARLVELNATPEPLPGMLRWRAMSMLCHVMSPFPKLPLYRKVPHKIAPDENLRRYVPPELVKNRKTPTLANAASLNEEQPNA